jgi:hypothetical protein
MQSSIFEYTDNGSTFNSLPPLPESDYGGSRMAAFENGNIFVACENTSKSCYLYENNRRAWEKCQDMPTKIRYGK